MEDARRTSRAWTFRPAGIAQCDVARLREGGVLKQIAGALRREQDTLLSATSRTSPLPVSQISPLPYERLKLSEKRIAAMADGVEQIAAQVDPVGQVIEGFNRPNGLRIEKVRVPIGVVLFFYESRPNVTSDAAPSASRAATP